MLKGINQWCYPDGTPLDKVFEYSKNAGFEAVELNLNPAGGVGLTVDSTKEQAEEIKALAAEHQLQLRSLSTSLFWQKPLCSPDENIRQEGIDVAEKMLEIASYVGADTILVVPGVVNVDITYDDCHQEARNLLNN